jgi:serine phosphatase RsbU (regulator of sigma subunit)
MNIIKLSLCFITIFVCNIGISFSKEESGYRLYGVVCSSNGLAIRDAEIVLYDSKKKILETEFSDQNGFFEFPSLNPNEEFFIRARTSSGMNRIISISTKVTDLKQSKTIKLLLPKLTIKMAYKKEKEVEQSDFNNIQAFIFYNKKKGSFDFYEKERFSFEMIDAELLNSTNTSNKNNRSIVENGGSIKIKLSVRTANINTQFENCLSIKHGIIHLYSSGYKDSLILNDNLESISLVLKPSVYEKVVVVESHGFFRKSFLINTSDVFRGAYQLNRFDSINLILDSSFNSNIDSKLILYEYEFKSGKLKLRKDFKKTTYPIDIRIELYNDLVERATQSKNDYYKSLLAKKNQLLEPVEVNKSKDNKLVKALKAGESNRKLILSDNKKVEEFELNIDQLERKQPSQFNITKLVFKNDKADKLPFRVKNDFQRFGFDTMPVYIEREVEKHLKDIIDASKNINTMQDTLNLYMHLYQLNKDFIYVGNKKISEISGKSERQLLLVEILKVINEKELENYSIRKEVRELHLKLDAKSVLLKFERYKLIFIAIIAFFLLIIIYNKFHQYKKLKEITNLLNLKNREVKDSIQYAQRIQFAILPTQANIAKAFPQSFVLFKPKDIVSGDFYWFQKVEGKKFIAACDCTGHGVPGALMSMVATDMLNEALVHTKKVDEILAHTNRSIRLALKQSSDDDSTRDGMDIALCCFDDQTNLLKYAGAYRPLWLIRTTLSPEGRAGVGFTLAEYKATKAAIGGLTEDNQVFQINEIQLQKGDTIYLSSDGYADQFSPADKKLMTKRFKEILLSIQPLSMPEQEKYLEKFITDWRGNMEQTDDVLVIGVRV